MIQKRRKDRGFTLIELLVVIAIIGVLSSVVLASLNSARGKGNDAKVKAQLSSARGSAEIYYSNQNPPSYGTSSKVNGTGAGTGLCNAAAGDASGVDQYLDGSIYPDSTPPTCHSIPQAYAMWRSLPFAGGEWCVDSKGASKGVPAASPVPAGSTQCP